MKKFSRISGYCFRLRNTMSREMGLDAEYLHRPQPAAETLLYQTIADAIEEYEPRAELVSIDFEEDTASGVIIPVVEVEINE